jgi:hypothetical protein
MKLTVLLLLSLVLASCGGSSGSKSKKTVVNTPQLTIDAVIAELSYPASGQVLHNGELLADLSNPLPVVSSYGTVTRGQTLNVVTINGIDFLIYGEDGAFAVECEPNVDYPTHGPAHPDCEVAHAESFDTIIICNSSDPNTPILQAQNWPGYPSAMTDETLGMQCWIDGVKMKSQRIFTY